jgi:adenine-specific DNA-methyltransferase
VKNFSKDGHQIIWGDVIQCLESISDESIDLIFCDPPYNIGKNFNGTKDKWETEEAYRSLRVA